MVHKETAHVLVEKSNLTTGKAQEKYLKKSLEHFNLALTVITKKSNHSTWLGIQEMLGNIYKGLLLLVEEKDDMLKSTIEHYDVALATCDPVQDKEQWISISKAKAEALYNYSSSGINDEKYTSKLKTL